MANESLEGSNAAIGRGGPSFRISSMLKGVLLMTCVGGFSYQMAEFITYFYTYPTVIVFNIEKPLNFIEPAITVCDMNPVKRTAFCKKYPDYCEEPKNLTQFCKYRPIYCKKRNTNDGKQYEEKPLLIPKYPNLNFDENATTRKMMADVISLSFEEQFLTWGSFSGPYRIQSTAPCYVSNSKVYTNQEPIQTDFELRFRFTRIGRSTEIGWYSFILNKKEVYDYESLSSPSAIVAFHSPFEVVDPSLAGVLLSPGSYNVYIRLEENRLLPLPYKTDCYDYEKEWLKNNKTGPRSQQVCVNICWKNYYKACFNCYASLLKVVGSKECNVNKPALCDMESANEERRKCQSQCKPKCKVRKYPFRFQVRPTKPAKYHTGPNKEFYEFGEILSLEVFIEEPEIKVYEHKPQYLDVEIFSYVGGFLGCWLGISIWSSSISVLDIPSAVKSRMKKYSFKFRDERVLRTEIRRF